MSERRPERRRDGAWIEAVAASRGIALGSERAAEVASQVAPVLERFDAFVAELSADEDVHDLRRRLEAEAGG
jgi:hypothetical protein